MLNLIIAVFIILVFVLFLLLNKRHKALGIFMQSRLAFVQAKYQGLSQEYDYLKGQERDFSKELEGTISLYNITKDICKSLDKEKVFLFFKEEVNKYLAVGDCFFIKEGQDMSGYKDHLSIPLDIDETRAGYLLVCDIKDSDRDKFNIIAQQFLLGFKRAMLYEKVQELSITDVLTGAFSRKYCLDRLEDELLRSKNIGLVFSLLMIDIDHFKDFNDKYGHLVGDAILKEVSSVIKASIRQIDLMGRYGGEEFIVILTETAAQEAQTVAERIRQAIQEASIKAYDEDLKVTVSIGVSVFPSNGRTSESLINKSDQALYRAKNTGRNKVCVI